MRRHDVGWPLSVPLCPKGCVPTELGSMWFGSPTETVDKRGVAGVYGEFDGLRRKRVLVKVIGE